MKEIVSETNKILAEYLEGNKKIAYRKLKKISEKYPTNEKLKFNLAFMEQDQGNFTDAKESYKYLIEKFNYFNAKFNLYKIYLKEKSYLKSLNLINDILSIKDDLVDVWLDKAYLNYKIAEFNESKKICYSILKKIKNNTSALNLIGLCLFKEKKYNDSLDILLKGLKINKLDLSLLNSIGEVYYELRNLEKSEEYYLRGLEINPNSYQTLNNLAGFYLETNNSEKALTLYKKALKIYPNEPTILENISKTYLSLDNIELAKKYCRKTLNIKNSGSTHKLLAFVYFKEQNYTNAWRHFDGRLEENEFKYKNNSLKIVKEKLLNQKKIDPKKQLLIIREQGVGDEILYGTIYRDVLERFENTYIEADERLIDLFIESFGEKYKKNFKNFGFFSKDKKNMKFIDQTLYAGSLGYYFRNNLNDFPKNDYLKINQNLINATKQDLSDLNKRFNIGISWKSLNNPYAEQKSLSLNRFLNLLMLPDINFINLQYGKVFNEIEKFNSQNGTKLKYLQNLDLFNDFLKVASLLKNLDLFITVSNSTAHLAGGLGVKTLLVKPFN